MLDISECKARLTYVSRDFWRRATELCRNGLVSGGKETQAAGRSFGPAARGQPRAAVPTLGLPEVAIGTGPEGLVPILVPIRAFFRASLDLLVVGLAEQIRHHLSRIVAGVVQAGERR